MGPDFLLGLVIFFGFLFIGRVFNMKAINSLTNEDSLAKLATTKTPRYSTLNLKVWSHVLW